MLHRFSGPNYGQRVAYAPSNVPSSSSPSHLMKISHQPPAVFVPQFNSKDHYQAQQHSSGYQHLSYPRSNYNHPPNKLYYLEAPESPVVTNHSFISSQSQETRMESTQSQETRSISHEQFSQDSQNKSEVNSKPKLQDNCCKSNNLNELPTDSLVKLFSEQADSICKDVSSTLKELSSSQVDTIQGKIESYLSEKFASMQESISKHLTQAQNQIRQEFLQKEEQEAIRFLHLNQSLSGLENILSENHKMVMQNRKFYEQKEYMVRSNRYLAYDNSDNQSRDDDEKTTMTDSDLDNGPTTLTLDDDFLFQESSSTSSKCVRKLPTTEASAIEDDKFPDSQEYIPYSPFRQSFD